MLDVHRLRVFRSVVASGSVQAAAANLGYTPSAISQHLTTLQRETGLTLLVRAGRGIRPTAAGRALADHADGVLARLGEAESFVADLRSGRAGSLSIAYFPSVGAAWLPSVVRELTSAFPDVRLDLELREDVARDRADRPDLQIVVARAETTNVADVTTVHLIDDPYVAVVPSGHPRAGDTDVELADLASERWIDNDFSHGWCRQNLVDACHAAGFAPAFHLETHDYPTALALVDAGIGITVLPEIGAAALPPGAVAVPVVRPTPVRSIYAFVDDAVVDHPPVRTALEALRAAAGATTR